MSLHIEQTSDQAETLRRRYQYHRIAALAQVRKAIENPQAANQEVTLFAVLQLAFDSVGQMSGTYSKPMLRSHSLSTAISKLGSFTWKASRPFCEIVMEYTNLEKTLYFEPWLKILLGKVHKRPIGNSSSVTMLYSLSC
jgi:hypothetical protein